MPDKAKATTLYRTDLIHQVAHQTGLSPRVVADVLRASQQVIEQALAAGETVTLPGFGTFYTRQQPERRVRHIQSGKTIRIPMHRVAAFRVGAVLKRAVRGQRLGRRWW